MENTDLHQYSNVTVKALIIQPVRKHIRYTSKLRQTNINSQNIGQILTHDFLSTETRNCQQLNTF